MKKLLSQDKAPALLIILLTLCSLICIILCFCIKGYSGYDINGHWRITAYALSGYNPYELIGQPAQIDEIGAVPAAFSTVPWGCIFGSIFYAGFLPIKWAHVYVFTFHFVAVVGLLLVLCKRFYGVFSRYHIIVLLLLPFAQFSFMYSLRYGNAGGIICCLLMIAFFLEERHPILSGIFLGMAMMKPQIAGIICIVFLLKKQWKTLFVAAGFVFSGWISTSIVVDVDPLQLLEQTFSSGTAAPTQYLGLLNNLKYADIDSTYIMLINVLIGCFYTVGMYFYMRKHSPIDKDSIFVYIPSCIASVFWIYKNGTDYMILVFVAIFFVLLCMKKALLRRDYLLSILCIVYVEMSRCVVYLGAVLFSDNQFVRDLFKSVDGILLGLIGIYLCSLWIKYEGHEILEEKDAILLA